MVRTMHVQTFFHTEFTYIFIFVVVVVVVVYVIAAMLKEQLEIN